MARTAWPWTLVVVVVASLVSATVATTALILLVRAIARLGRPARRTAAPAAWRPSSNGVGTDRDRSRPVHGNRDQASPARRAPHRRPPA
jgi:hypothetical protein